MPDATPILSTSSRDEIGRVLGRTPSGVFILTAIDGEGRETAMLASWVQQASFEPPMITVAMNRQRYLHDWLDRVPRLALNIVGEKQREFLRHFGRGFEPGEPAFEGIAISRTAHGLPVLDEALGHLAGRIAGRIEAGDHVVYLVEIEEARAGEAIAEKQPMVHIRRNGFGY
ncbi:MAG: flavin reductase family protein [Planctomycetales bacterium]